MASRLSSDHPESLHPCHANQSRSTTSLETTSSRRRNFLSRLLPLSRRDGLLPLPEGVCLSSSSPPPTLPVLPQMPRMPLDLPHPASTPDSQLAPGDLMWATTFDPSLLPPSTILGVTGTMLHHPQPRSASSGITLTFPTVPTSPLTMAPQDTKHHPKQATGTTWTGDTPYNPHSSLYTSRNPLPAPQLPISTHQGAATGRMSWSSTHHDVSCDLPQGSDSRGDLISDNESYSRPLSHNMDISPVKQTPRTWL